MSASASALENELNILPYVYEVLKSIENDGSDVAQKMIELKEQFQRARECVDKLPGVQYSQEEQLRLKAVLQEQLIVKNELLMNYKSGTHFDNLSSNGDIPSNLSNIRMAAKVNHPIFTQDPSDWIKLVHSYVSVDTEDGGRHQGYVYTVDPVSESIVLITRPPAAATTTTGITNGGDLSPSVNNNDLELLSPSSSRHTDHFSMKIIMRPSVAKLTVERDAEEGVRRWFNGLFRESSAGDAAMTDAELAKRKDSLRSWLEKNRIPVTTSGRDDESLSILSNALVIRPPYTEHSCLSTNEIILLRVQGLIRNMPPA